MPWPESVTSSSAPWPAVGEPDRDRGVRGGVLADVAEQVGQHLPDPRLVRHHDQAGRRAGPDRALRLHRPGVLDRVRDQRGQVGLGQVEGGVPVQPGQLEQLGDQAGHPVRLLLDAAHGVRQPVLTERTLPVQLGVPADGGERRAQLVRRVRGELPHLLLGLPARPERLLDPVQHRVDRPGQPPRLGVVARVGHPGGQVAPAGDHVGGARHPVERRQAAADQPAAAHREQGEQDRAGDQLGGDQAADLAAHRAVRPRDQQDAGARGNQVLVVLRFGGKDRPPDRGQRRVIRQRDAEQGPLRIAFRAEVLSRLPLGGQQVADQGLQLRRGRRRAG